MQVLYQEWKTQEGERLCSISKDAIQLQQTIKKLMATGKATPKSEALMVEISDHSGFIDTVQVETMFLQEDERNVLIFPK